MRKIEAFTIIELVMSLLISGIVIGIVYYAFLFFNRQSIDYQFRSKQISEYFLFNKSLLTDFERAESISDSSENFLIIQHIDTGMAIIYEFGTSAITRKTQETVDSFSIKCEELRFYHLAEGSSIVNKVMVKLNINNSSFNTVFLKTYSAAQILDAEIE